MRKSGAAIALAAVALASAGAAAPAGQTPARTVPVKVFLSHGPVGTRCDRVAPRQRLVPAPAVLRGAIASLLRGPTPAERTRGYGGWFSQRTSGMLRSVRLTQGVAYVDFRDLRRVIPNASASCGSALLLAQLDRTATQFRSVRRAVYSINGSPAAFYEWLQREPPR